MFKTPTFFEKSMSEITNFQSELGPETFRIYRPHVIEYSKTAKFQLPTPSP